MNESTKSKVHWGPLEETVLTGTGIDIGCGPDPVKPNVRKFDIEDGDANRITEFVSEQFDFVYSSHCLEHMHVPEKALHEWWKLVKPGGHLVFLVPDEDLYEQGYFPSRFNPDHKATFTVSKSKSWSPVSINVLDLAKGLPDSEIVSLALQDYGYDRSLMAHINRPVGRLGRFVLRGYNAARKRGFPRILTFERLLSRFVPIDQTLKPDALAQIQCIIKKLR